VLPLAVRLYTHIRSSVKISDKGNHRYCNPYYRPIQNLTAVRVEQDGGIPIFFFKHAANV
jgi:hypothetical protein